MCQKCGCNTCETDSTALMLNESKAPKTILSEGLKHHIDNNKPLTEHLYRAGSNAYFNLMAEARSLYSRGILEFTNEDDLGLLTETDLGHFGMFEGKKVPLDFPIELNEQMDIYDDVANMEFGMDYDQLGSNEKEWVRDEIDNMEMRESLNENKVVDYIKNQSKEVIDNLKAKIQKVITTAKEEGGETLQMVKLLAKQKRGTKLTPQESKLVSDQGKDLLKMLATGLGAASGFGAIVSVLPATATIAALISAINFLDLDDELLKYTDSSKDSARGLTSVEKDKTNFKDIGGVKYIKYDKVAPYLDQADAVAENIIKNKI